MKSKIKILTLAIFCLILSSCSLIDTDFSKIKSPTVSKTPVNGKWIITKVIFTDDEQDTSDIFSYKDYIGKDVFIKEDGIIVGDKLIYNPNFKAKKVELDRYISKKFDIDQKKLNISGEYLSIVDVYDRDDFVFEIIKVDEDKAFIYDNKNFIQINRISNEVKEEEYETVLKRIDPNQQGIEVEDE